MMMLMVLANFPTTIFQRLSWSAADCTIYEGDETGGKVDSSLTNITNIDQYYSDHHGYHTQHHHHNHQVLFKIAHNDLRDRAVFDANGVEIPTGYRRKMLAMLPVYALIACGC